MSVHIRPQHIKQWCGFTDWNLCVCVCTVSNEVWLVCVSESWVIGVMSNRTWRKRGSSQEEKRDRRRREEEEDVLISFFITIDYTSKGSVCVFVCTLFWCCGMFDGTHQRMTCEGKSFFRLQENYACDVGLKSGSLILFHLITVHFWYDSKLGLHDIPMRILVCREWFYLYHN